MYPQELGEKHLNGKVQLKVTIGSDGKILGLVPISSTDPLFTEAAITSVKEWTYKPYVLNGSPVQVETMINLIFKAP